MATGEVSSWSRPPPRRSKRTTLGGWRPGTRVNLERPLRLGDELGGHIVSGHVDGLAEIVSIVGKAIRGASASR
jgi:riboflavin synthase alpha subunit